LLKSFSFLELLFKLSSLYIFFLRFNVDNNQIILTVENKFQSLPDNQEIIDKAITNGLKTGSWYAYFFYIFKAYFEMYDEKDNSIAFLDYIKVYIFEL